MSDEGFLERWSRRKREVARSEAPVEEAAPPVAEGGAAPATDEGRPAAREAADSAAPAFDVSQLPPLDSITAATDIRSFLAPGVPSALRHAALRRVWSSDPAIRDFIGLSENSWDFTAPDGVPGFGPIGSADEVRKLLAQLTGEPLEAGEKSSDAPVAQADQSSIPARDSAEPQGEPPCQPVAISPDRQDEPESNPGSERADTGVLQDNKDIIASQQETPSDQDVQRPARRSHGRALPE